MVIHSLSTGTFCLVGSLDADFHWPVFANIKSETGSLFLVPLSKNSVTTFQRIVIQVVSKKNFCTSPWLCIKTSENDDCD